MEPPGSELGADAWSEDSAGVVGMASVEPPARVVDPNANSSFSGFMLAAGIVVLTLTVLVRGKRLRQWLNKRGTAAAPSPAATPPPLEPRDAQAVAEASRARLAQAEKEARSRQTLEALMVEVQELTRLCAGQIENRAVRLERLIADADTRLAELRAIEARQPSPDPRTQDQPETRTPLVSTRSVRAARSISTTERPTPEPLPPEALRRSSVLTMEGAGRAPNTGSHSEAGGMEPLTRRVYELADRGMSALDIARKLEEQIGKVQLILSLRRG